MGYWLLQSAADYNPLIYKQFDFAAAAPLVRLCNAQKNA
jgi:hypothetical protein